MKTLDILRTASSNLSRSKLRTSLTIIAIFIGSLTLSLTNGIGAGVSSYIDKQLGNVGAKDVLIVQQKQEARSSGNNPQKYDPDQAASSSTGGFSFKVLTDQDLEKIKATKGVKSVEPQLSATPEYISSGGEKYKATISPYIEGTKLDLAAGGKFQSGDNAREVIIPLSYVKTLGFSSNSDALGKQVVFGIKYPTGQMQEVDAEIIGVQQKTLIGSGGIVINQTLTKSLREIQTSGLPPSLKNQYAAAIVRFDINASKDTLDTIKKQLGDEGYQAMTIEDTIGILKDIIGAITMVLNFFAAIALLAASFGIINTLLMAVQERTKEIGLMKAMGMSGARIFMLFSTEAVLLGFWGSVLGVFVANIIGLIVNRVASDGFLKDLPGFDLLVFPPSSMLLIIAIIMVVAFVAGTLPARRAAKQNPIDALRYE